ncbi:Type II secretory pathway, ATPase PulE/Tfp pilus assembly pathway, ATPase PilB [Olavius sp. associated proteobacterium Delta 1]|nr:Type II secretory pathway, ATPase PulE/Tfp pilus assembly pathway, ATPase PilB [Olavius sp. associated proteobacterium Delta 1]
MDSIVSAPNEFPLPEDVGRSSQIVELLLREKMLTDKQVDYAARVLSKIETPRPMLEVLKELNYIDDDKIKDTVRHSRVPMCIGSLLVELGYIPFEDVQRALKIQSEDINHKKLGEILLDRRLIDEHSLIEVLSLQMGFPQLEPEFSEIDPELFSKVNSRWYDKHDVIPIHKEDGGLVIAFADPLDRNDLEAVKQVFGDKFIAGIARKSSIKRAVRRCLTGASRQKISPSDENSIIKLVDDLLLAAIERDASDIHIEPMKETMRVRFRQDGVLIKFQEFQINILPALTNRVKVLCDVDITEKRRHQGGRFYFDYPGGQVDLRVSFYVTVHGEKIVMRLLNRKGVLINIEDVGLSQRMEDRFKEDALYMPSGVILITGPTGSGKTTTVYSCINHINTPETSIITAEEPVEYIIEGIAQCSINPRINLTFEETLRHIVRQDPDVIVIGEIRDNFSAEIAVQAALTGHKVLTTFHTEDSIGGLVRLLNMNIEAFLISSTVVSVMAQRLLRKICPICAVAYKPSPADLQRIGYAPGDITGAAFRKGHGCGQCQYTGYSGRIGIFELLILDEQVRNAIIDQKTSQEIRLISIESTGLVTLLEDGIVKAAAGLTTIDEILRSLPRLQKPRALPELRRLLEG